MTVHRRIITLSLLTVSALLGRGAAPICAAEGAAEEPEARLARRIASALEAGRVAEAEIDARRGVEQYPANALLRLRSAQSHVCLAILRGNELEAALENAVWSEKLRRVGETLPNLSDSDPERPPERREYRRQLLEALAGALVIRFQEKALEGLKKSEGLLEQRSQALLDAFAALKEARRLGEASTELELTDLWAQTLVFCWRQAPEKLRGLGKERLAAMEKALALFAGIQPDTVLRAAAALAKERAEDPSALAGGADVISVVAGISKKPDPLGDRIRTILDRAYRENAEVFEPSVNAAGMERARMLYIRLRDSQNPDVLTEPATVAFQLYSQAHGKDPHGTLPYLRLRLYLLRVAFDPDAARPLLEEIRRREPGNVVVPLEQGRAAFLMDKKPLEGMKHLQEAARLPGFSRSYLVAVPAPLRASLKFQPQLREWSRRAWPGYAPFFSTLDEMTYPRDAVIPGMTRAQRQLYFELAEQIDLPTLYAALTDRICQAQDYGDQATGIDRKDHILGLMATIARKQEQRAAQQRLLKQQAEHRVTFAGYPRARSFMRFSPTGITFLEYPSLGKGGWNPEGAYVILSPDSDNFFGQF
jgi:hypothetical protein